MKSANLPYKKVQNKHGKQLIFMYHFVLEHKRGLVRPASLWFARKASNFWYQDCAFQGSTDVIWTLGLKDAWWLSNPHLTINSSYNYWL